MTNEPAFASVTVAESNNLLKSGLPTKALFCGILTGALLLRLVLVFLLRNRPTHDLRIFVSWAQLLIQYGSHHLYEHVDTIDHYPVNYPPLFSVILSVVVTVYKSLTHGRDDFVLLGMLLKLPAVVADLTLCILAFRIVRRWAGAKPALVALALAAFAPTTWPISAMWGQVDSVSTAFMVLALTFALRHNFYLAWIALTLAVLVKPLPIVVAPLIVAAQFNYVGWSLRLLIGPACGAAIAYLVSLPFAPTGAPIGAMHWLALELITGQSLSDSTSINAYNIWTIAGTVTSDAHLIFGFARHTFGWLAFLIIVSLVTYRVLSHKRSENDYVAQEKFTSRAWFVVLIGLFIVLTRMHERYILFALALAPLVYFCGWWERRVAVILVLTFTTCVILVLGFYEHSWLHEAVAVTRFLSVVNVAAFAAILITFFFEQRSPRISLPIE